MKRFEQAILFLRKAAQDEALLDEVGDSANVSDEVFGFHCQQAAEKLLKALLSATGATIHKTHDLAVLLNSLSEAGETAGTFVGGKVKNMQNARKIRAQKYLRRSPKLTHPCSPKVTGDSDLTVCGVCA